MSSDSIPSALRFAAAVAAIALAPTARSNDQNIYLVSKSQLFFQTASSGSVADPITGAAFGVEASSNVTLTLPGGGTTAVTQSGGSSSAKLDQTFATKAALDAAFPNGTYKLTGPSIPALTFNLGTETYPTATPSVINGTWTNGVLVVNPAASTTINFSTDSTYASAGVAGHMSLEIDSTTNNENVDLQQQIATQGVFGLTQASAPFTSYTIPANTLIDGHVYQVELDFNALSTLDTTSLPDGGAVAIWQKGLHFYIVASSAGKLTAPTVPVLANVGTTAGGKVTLGLPTFDSTNAHTDWFFNGQQLNFDGTSTKYSFENYPSLTINNVVAADAGTYQARIVTPGGLVTSNVATLTINASNVSPFTTQPSNQSAASGGTVSLSAIASGNPAYQWQFDGLDLSGETGFTLALSSFTAAASGLYTVSVNSGAAISAAAIVGMLTDAAVTGDGNVVQTSIAHPNGKLYDQVVLTGAAAAIHTQGGRTTRTSFIDENNDIVQVEF
ncbi:MAG TPA: hypothetical protein VG710_02115, partial [Opitutus sp.]|nr:hypothetical protein [Opitutus sp.]